MPITNLTDYQTGRFALPINSINSKDLISEIERVEAIYLKDLLGDTPLDSQIESRGVKTMLQGFVCFEFLRLIEYQSTIVGLKKSNSENSENKTLYSGKALTLYNQSIKIYQEIQTYIYYNYPEFTGTKKHYICSI